MIVFIPKFLQFAEDAHKSASEYLIHEPMHLPSLYHSNYSLLPPPHISPSLLLPQHQLHVHTTTTYLSFPTSPTSLSPVFSTSSPIHDTYDIHISFFSQHVISPSSISTYYFHFTPQPAPKCANRNSRYIAGYACKLLDKRLHLLF